MENCKMDFKDFIEITSNIFVCVGVFIAIISFYADHRRRKKQATFEFYHSIREKLVESLNRIEKETPNDQVISVSAIEENDELLSMIKSYLSHMERFAIGIKSGTYDIRVFKRMVGATLTVYWINRFREVIEYLRQKYDNPFAYKDLEDLVSKLKK